MKRIAVALLLLFAACKNEPPAAVVTDTRQPIEVLYVSAPEAKVYAKPAENSEVLATYQNGEAMSVLAKQGEWSEVRFEDASGWVKAADLGTAQQKQQAEETPTPKFKIMPLPVSAPSAHGEIYYEADVNSDGEIVSVKTLNNTTGSEALAAQNAAALRASKFQPIVVKGERKPFKYYHKVSY